MRKILLFLSLFISAQAIGQFVIGNSPSDVEGSYAFGTADWGPQLLDSVWTGDLRLINDGSAEPTLGCAEVMEAGQLEGFIAVIDRGTCNFSLKSFNAQEVGAIAVIIINNEPLGGIVNMTGGDRAADGVIPSVFLTFEDGEILKAAMANGPVNMTLGNVVFANNISAPVTQVVSTTIGTVPQSELIAEGVYTLTPGALVSNTGTNDATNVNVDASINWTPAGGTPTTIYNETATIDLIAPGDSIGALTSEFDFFGSGIGTYDINYEVSADSIDGATFDNAASTAVSISQNTFSKAPMDATTGRPRMTTGLTIAGGGPIEFMSPFRINNGVGNTVTQIGFNVSAALSLAGQSIAAYLYRWEDIDANGGIGEEELTLLGLGIQDFPADDTTDNIYLTLDILDLVTFTEGYQIQESDEVLIAGVRYEEGAETIFFGFDGNMDYTQAITDPATTDAELPYIGVNAWTNALPNPGDLFLFGGTQFAVSTEMIITPNTVNTRELSEDIISLQTFPNPVSDNLTVSYDTNERFTDSYLRIFNTNGQVMFSERVNFDGIGTMDINVSNFATGNYIMSFTAEEGILTKSFNVAK